ncbi:MAG: TolC family protein [Treponema sp.]|nr:TolC family protein [Treponema sp.]
MKKLFFVIAVLMSVTVIFAQEIKATDKSSESEVLTLTVEDAVNYAMENSKSLKSSAIDLEIAKRAADNSWNVLLPSLSASATASRQSSISSTVDSANNAASSAFKLKELDARVATIEKKNVPISADFYSMMSNKPVMEDTETNHWAVIGNVGAQWNFNLAMIESIKAAKKQYEAGQITWEQANRDTEVNIRKMFYGILLQQGNLDIQKESLKNAESRWKQAEINYKNGMVPRLSMLNAKVTYENKKPTVLSAEQSLKQNKEMFGFLLGLPYGKPIELVGSIEFSYIDVDADDLFRDYIDRNNDIIALQKKKDLLEISIRAKQLSTFTPSLSVGYTYQPLLYSAGSWASGTPTDNGSLSFTLIYSNLFNMLPFSSNMQEIKN